MMFCRCIRKSSSRVFSSTSASSLFIAQRRPVRSSSLRGRLFRSFSTTMQNKFNHQSHHSKSNLFMPFALFGLSGMVAAGGSYYLTQQAEMAGSSSDESPFSMYAKCEMKILQGRSHPELARDVANALGIQLSEAEVKNFNNGETAIKIKESVRDCDVFVIQSTCYPEPNDAIVELCIMVDALRRAGAARITVVMPHYAYARNSFKAKSRTPIVSKLIADMLETTGVDRVVTIDLHSSQIQGFANYPIDNLDGLPTLRNFMLRLGVFGDDVVVVASSPHGAKMAESLSKQLGSGFALNSKVRERDNVTDHPVLVGDVKNKKCICLVDIIDTGETLCRTSKVVKEAGAQMIIGAAIHGIFSDTAVQDLENSDLDQVVVMDTVPCVDRCEKSKKITVLSSANLLAHAIWRIHMGGSLSQLYRYDSAAHVARPLNRRGRDDDRSSRSTTKSS